MILFYTKVITKFGDKEMIYLWFSSGNYKK